MPLTLIVTEGVIAKDREAQTMGRLSEAFLKLHGLAGNPVMTPNVIGSLQVVAKGNTYAGLEPASVGIVEWKVPSFAFTNRDVQLAYVAEATDIVHEASGRTLPKASIWVNVSHAVDGAWGIAGRAYTNEELRVAVSNG
jgi:phenylpyruvate tautomerase PptA (4-oxalocrotonate tautomerase family)